MSPKSTATLWKGRSLALVGIALVAVNTRTALTSISPIVENISIDIPIDTSALSVIGMLPPICFAVFGLLAPSIARAVGLELAIILTTLVASLGHVMRAVTPNLAVLIIASAVIFAGSGIANVLLPPLVKRYFPDRVGLITALYIALMSVSTSVPALLAVPITNASTWRVSLSVWAIVCISAALPWVALFIRNHRHDALRTQLRSSAFASTTRSRPVWRSSTARALTTVLAVATMHAYALFAWLPSFLIEAGNMSAAQAGGTLAIYSALALPGAVIGPVVAARLGKSGVLIASGMCALVFGTAGLLFFPQTLTLFWVVLCGLGAIIFPVSMTLINQRTRSESAASAFSGFAQGTAYAFGAAGTFLFGYLHQLYSTWTIPLAFLLGLVLIGSLAVPSMTKPRMLEDR